MAIAFDHELFEPTLMEIMLDISKVKECYDDMKMMVDIVEMLNLNIHIWGK